jgi:hypothetical protein
MSRSAGQTTEIFVNYRTGDEPFAAILLDELMVARFGPDMVFRDGRAIRLGEEFRDRLWESLASSSVLLVVIGPRWLTIEVDGVRKLDQPNDYVRREIAFALANDITVVPVLVGDTSLPREADLPDDIKPLVFQQYHRIHPRNEHRDIRALADELAAILRRTSPDLAASTTSAKHDVRPDTRYSIVAVKAEGFTALPGSAQTSVRSQLYDVLRRSAGDARLSWTDFVVVDRVDGIFALVPEPVSPADVAGTLVTALDTRLRQGDEAGENELRLRVALHYGRAAADAHGWVGHAITLAWRLADAPVAGDVLAAMPRARLAVIVSDEFHRIAVVPGLGDIDPATYLPARLGPDDDLTAWVRVPGSAAPRGLNPHRPPRGPSSPERPEADRPERDRAHRERAEGQTTVVRGFQINNSTINGDLVDGNKTVYNGREERP